MMPPNDPNNQLNSYACCPGDPTGDEQCRQVICKQCVKAPIRTVYLDSMVDSIE